MSLPMVSVSLGHGSREKTPKRRIAFTIGQPIAKSAIDMAVHDLIGCSLGIGLRELIGSRGAQSIPSAWIVSTTDPAEARQMAASATARGYTGLKVKVEELTGACTVLGTSHSTMLEFDVH